MAGPTGGGAFAAGGQAALAAPAPAPAQERGGGAFTTRGQAALAAALAAPAPALPAQERGVPHWRRGVRHRRTGGSCRPIACSTCTGARSPTAGSPTSPPVRSAHLQPTRWHRNVLARWRPASESAARAYKWLSASCNSRSLSVYAPRHRSVSVSVLRWLLLAFGYVFEFNVCLWLAAIYDAHLQTILTTICQRNYA